MFLHPAALWSLLAAVTPVVIYLLLRRRKTEIPWGASYLLRKTLASKRKSSVWKQYVVLAVRTLILALMALLLAQPFRPNPRPAFLVPEPPPEPVHRVLLLDHSLSMTVGDAGDTRLNRLKNAVRALLTAQRPGDQTTVLSLLDPEIPLTPHPLTGRISPAEIQSLLDRITPREASLRLAAARARATAALAATPRMFAEIFLLSDFPRDLAPELERLADTRESATPANARLRFIAVNLANPDTAPRPSVSLESATLGTDLVIAHVPVNLHLELANRSDAETLARVRLTATGLVAREETIVLPPNARRTVPLTVTFTQPGVHRLDLSATPSLLRSASETSLSVEVRPQLHAMLLEDPADPSNPQALGEGEFLRRAFNPSATTAATNTALKLTSINLLDLTRAIPTNVDLVIIAGARIVTPAIAEPLTRFVRQGGGLVLAMSPAVVPVAYNDSIKTLLPAPLDAPHRAGFDPESFQNPRADTLSAAPGLFTEFADGLGAELAAARIYNFMRLGPLAENSRTILELADRQPLLLERRVGRGRVLFFASSLGVSWSSLPVRQTSVAFLHRLTHAAAAGRAHARNLTPGEPFLTAWPATNSVTVVAPDQNEFSAAPIESAGKQFLSLPGQSQRGTHIVRGENGHTEFFTVTAPPAEADLRPVDAAQAALLESLLDTKLHAGWPAAVAALGPADAHHDLWPLLLATLLALYLFETWFLRHL